MTEEEDQENARRNEIIKKCYHEIGRVDGRLVCLKCSARIAIMQFPRLALVPVFDFEDDE